VMKAFIVFIIFCVFVLESFGATVAPPAYDFLHDPDYPPIFGLDFLGWGFDATYRDPFFALKPQLFMFSFNNPPKEKSKSYRYPIDVNTYAVPDQVFVRTVAKTDTQSYTFDSTAQMRQELDLRINLNASTQQLSGELDVGVNFVSSNQQNTSIVYNFAETSLFQLYLGQRILRSEVLIAMNTLVSTFKLDPTSYNLFLAQYGTHYVDSIVIGGSVEQTTIIHFTNQTERTLLSVSLKGRFESSSGGSQRPSVSQGNNNNNNGTGGATTVSGSLNLYYNDIELKVETETTSDSEIYGGDPEFTDFVLTAGDPAATKLLFESWKATLMTNPVGVRYRLVELWTLLSDPQQQQELCTATGTLLGFLPKENPNYCSQVNQLLGGTIRQGLGGTQ